jgi:hypothetical protein
VTTGFSTSKVWVNYLSMVGSEACWGRIQNSPLGQQPRLLIKLADSISIPFIHPKHPLETLQGSLVGLDPLLSVVNLSAEIVSYEHRACQ